MKYFVLLTLLTLTFGLQAQNTPDALVNLALVGDATVSSSVPSGTGRGAPGHVLYDPAIGNYAVSSSYAEHGVTFGVNLGTASQGNGFNWQVEWSSPKNINYITFGGTYPNQPQPNAQWVISYFNGSTKITLDQGTGGWIDSGTYEWGGPDTTPIYTSKLLLEIFSNGTDDLVNIHIRGRGGISIRRDTSTEPVKACLVQYLPSNTTDTEAPTAPTLTSTGQSQSTVDLSWSGATDNVGVTGYTVYQDGSSIATLGNVTNYQVSGLSPSTAYTFKVQASDAAGNQSLDSNTISVTTDADPGNGSGNPGPSVWTEANTTASYTGEVAVGTSSVPTGYKMAVDGKLITEEVRVEASGTWPDYVFANDYDLPTLEEIQEHILEKGHLPNIPSARQVQQNGLELGEMNRLLLEKIEELTLHILQQEQRIKNLENKN